MSRSNSLRLPESIGQSNARVDVNFRAHLDKKFHKIVDVVDFIAATGAVGAQAVIEACEIFATGNARQWLKVAGEEKA